MTRVPTISKKKRPRGRAKGCKKYGGRAPGTPNKLTKDFMSRLQEFDLDVVKEIVETIKILPPEPKMQALLNLMNFIYPKRKAIDITADIKASMTLTDLISSIDEKTDTIDVAQNESGKE